jgi:predicted TIM-barrel fold metal-dependent hydrolase
MAASMSRRPDLIAAASPRRGPAPRRRDVLAAGALAIAACAGPLRAVRAPGRRFDQPIVVDIHCHDFNASDLPITGFLARTFPGLSELTRTVSPIPEKILRTVIGTIHGAINAATPTATEERAWLEAALMDARADPVPAALSPVPPPPLTLPQTPLDALARQLAMLFPVDARRLRDSLQRLAETLYLVGNGRARIAATLATLYPQVALFTPLLVDYDAWSDDHPASPLASQIKVHQVLAQLSMRGRIGRPDARFHPFMAFDPLRETLRGRTGAPDVDVDVGVGLGVGAIALVRQAVEQSGFIGVKMYPPVGFLPLGNETLVGADIDADVGTGPGDVERGRALDRALRALYAICQAEEIPITAHASPSNEYALGFRELAAPERWAPVLREFPLLRLNFGHFGHDNGARGAHGVDAREAWMRQAAVLIEEHAHVYADLSGSPLVYDDSYALRWGANLKELCARFKRLPSRLMYGSDWWLNRFEPGAESTVTVFARRLEEWLGPRGRDDVMGRNALRFLGFIDDDNRIAVANRNRERLRAFYGAQPVPDWLA